jgi:LPXTG-motif cell wall-anchored protein
MPLLVETLILVSLAFLLGLGIGWLLSRRRKRKSYLDWEES